MWLKWLRRTFRMYMEHVRAAYRLKHRAHCVTVFGSSQFKPQDLNYFSLVDSLDDVLKLIQ